jgi:hypothetical protein
VPFLSMALVIGAVSGAFVTGGALDRGFPVEVAMVRGAVAFMAIAFAGYLGELVVVTAPRREQTRKPAVPAADAEEPHEPAARQTAPRLIASAALVNEDSNQDDADVDLRPAA